MKTQQPIQPPKCAPALASAVLIVLAFVLTGCGADSSSEDNSNNTIGSSNDTPPSLNQAAYMPSTATYQFGHNSIANIKIEGAPQDTDWNRWAMLHDGRDYRFCFLTL